MPAHALVQSSPVPLKRVLVLGTVDHPKTVTAYAWQDMPGYVNVADYDVVILNVAAAVEFKEDEEPKMPGREVFGRQWFAQDTEIVVVTGVEGGALEQNPFFWSPVEPERRREPGDVVKDIDDEWAWYLDRVKVFSDYFTGGYQERVYARAYFQALHMDADGFDVQIRPLANARHGKPIAIAMSVVATQEQYQHGPMPVAFSSDAYVVPALMGVPAADVVNLILQERYGFEITTPAPEWSGGFVLPSHAPVLGELVALRGVIADAQARLPDAEKRAAYAARFQALLYEGEDALEPLVRESLAKLGASVEEPTEKGVEDGRVTDPAGNNYMLEIKSGTKSLKIRDVRQAADWVNRGIEQDWDSRGLMVINMFRDTPLHERGEIVPDNALKAAVRFDQAILTTTQLFQALADFEADASSIETFWTAVDNAKGLVNLPELKSLPEPELPSTGEAAEGYGG